jgi:hypothetical protein
MDNGKDVGFLLVQNRISPSLKYSPLQYFHSRYECYVADKHFQNECILDCIPNPRISKAIQDREGYVAGHFNFNGGVEADSVSSFLFVTDQRSLVCSK